MRNVIYVLTTDHIGQHGGMYYMVHNLVKKDSEALVRLFYEERAVERDYRQCLVGEELFVNKSTNQKGRTETLASGTP